MAVRVKDLTGQPARPAVTVDHSVAMETLIELLTYGSEPREEMEAFESGQAWFDQVRMRASGELKADLERLGPQGGVSWINLAGLALLPTPVRDIPGFLARIESLSPDELWKTLLWYHVPMVGGVVGEERYRRAARGDPVASGELLEVIGKFDEDDPSLQAIVSLGPRETKRLVLRVIRDWHAQVFAPDEDRTVAVLARDVAAKRAMARTMSEEALVEAATSGLELRREAWMRRLLLVPHIAMRPWNILGAHDDVGLVVYPVADESLAPDRTAPPARLVRLHKALGDERRLRMLRRLSHGPATLQELADASGLAKSSAHHHLVILRSAGLLRVGIDVDSRYTLREDGLPVAAGMLSSYLRGEAS